MIRPWRRVLGHPALWGFLLLLGCGGSGGGDVGGGGGGGSTFNQNLLFEPGNGSLAGAPGTTVSTELDVTPATEVAGNVTLGIEGVPSGLSASFSSTILASGPSTLSITVSAGTAVGSYEFSVRAQSATETVVVPISVHVVAASTSSGLTLWVPPKMAMIKGQASSFEMGIDRNYGVTGSISLQATSVPAGLSVSFGENPCPDAGSLVTISVLSSVAVGSYEVALKGSTGGSSATRSLLVEVVDSASISDFWVSRVEFAQTYFDEDLRLVAGKSAFVRVHVIGDRAGITSPTVRVKAVNGLNVIGTMDLTGPTTVPTAEEPDSLSASYTGTMPASWVATGVEFRATLDPIAEVVERDESNNTLLASATIDNGKVLDLVVVPLTISGITAGTPDFDELITEHWPIRALNSTVRAPYTVTSISTLSTFNDWIAVISELANLRLSDGSSANYYGLINPSANSAPVAGLAYIGYPVAIGYDNSVPIMSHELGHNFGLAHAPCGGPSGADMNFPHTSASIGDWGFDMSATVLMDPGSYYDVMAYCWPYWVSGYNYKKVQSIFDTAGLTAQASSGPESLLLISGWIAAGVAEVTSVQRSFGSLNLPVPGKYKLRVEFTTSAWEFPFTPSLIGCGDGSGRLQFSICVPDPGDLVALEVLHGNTSLWRERSPAGSGLAEKLFWNEVNGALAFTWDVAAYTTVAVVFVENEQRHTLALGVTGGSAELETGTLPAGGQFEFSFSTRISGKRIRVNR